MHVLDTSIQTFMGAPLILAWVLAQILIGKSSSYLILHRQYPPTRLDLLPGVILVGLVFWQIFFYIFPKIPGVLPLTELSLPMASGLVGATWGGQGWFIYQAFRIMRSTKMI
jgi:hypothetical protein